MIYYEKHPVTPERKAELRGKGYTIVDAKFAPKEWQDPEAQKAEPKKQKRVKSDERDY